MLEENSVLYIKNLNIEDENGKELLKNISINAEKSDIVGIVGESGSGKTLTIKSILGIVPKNLNMNFEELKVLGENPYMMSKTEKRHFIGSKIGFVPQNTVQYLHPLIKIKDQITDGFIEHGFGNKEMAYEKALELINMVGLKNPKNVMNSLPSELSGGMRQRVNIAMAVMCEPEVLIADEPTTALDVEIQYQVMQLLMKIHKDSNNTMVIVSHDLKLIRKYCNQVIVMNKGEVV